MNTPTTTTTISDNARGTGTPGTTRGSTTGTNTGTSRRTFLHVTALAAAGLTAAGLVPGVSAMMRKDDREAVKKMRVLVLGGTGFLGPAIVEHALERGHEVTLFNRGRTRPELFAHLEQLRGDRDGDLEALKGRQWDVVIDTSGYVPRIVHDSATLLADQVRQYIFISSVSVYASNAEPNADEEAPVGTLDDPKVEEVTGATFGPLKALCEQAAEAAMPGRVSNIRPGLIVGKRDGSDRFTYWPVRIDRGGDVLSPGDGSDPVQLIDVMDLGRWIVHVAEKNTTGVFNALGPEGGMPMRTLLEACQDVSDQASHLIWVDAAFLDRHGVRAWSDMPAWVPATGDSRGFGTRSCARAVAAGLTFRPIHETCAETLAWFGSLPEERQKNLRAGISAEREREVLKAWNARD